MLMSAPMVRAILAGSKTQTRRIVKPRYPWEIEELEDGSPWPWYPDYVTGGEWDGWVLCPYGQPGDRLWVRETFQPLYADGWEDGYNSDGEAVNYKTGRGYAPRFIATDGSTEFIDPDGEVSSRVWPSIHMPRWASRITLEIAGVRVERLQDISEADAIAEGVDGQFCAKHAASSPWKDRLAPAAVHAFAALWESINGPGSWNANPWVWVVSFGRIRP
jgi:hypothetical protein